MMLWLARRTVALGGQMTEEACADFYFILSSKGCIQPPGLDTLRKKEMEKFIFKWNNNFFLTKPVNNRDVCLISLRKAQVKDA